MRFFCVVAIIGALTATPALAKKKEKKDTVVEAQTIAVRATPPALDDKTNQWLLDLSDGGRVTIALRPDAAPQTVERIKTLTRQHFYDGLAFHRVIDGFMAQGGDPKGDGTGGSSLPDLKAEFNFLPHVRGAVAAARSQSEDSANSQFYIIFQPKLSLDRKYTVFGRVIDGMQYVDAIERGEPPANPTRVVHAYIASDNPPAYQAAAPTQVNAGAILGPVTLPGASKAPQTTAKPRKQ
ncbi:peptidylprolyl isomerase [Sphingomonas sp. TX0543]|uniref:peptidylprolyl isomerase n=1 Tax=unclassified Sphingomonas TaxID=196159 RepID=UPI0010F9C353|nr:peptidylprolyl isomerase [Sphingomonas sp. 3P27F8]